MAFTFTWAQNRSPLVLLFQSTFSLSNWKMKGCQVETPRLQSLQYRSSLLLKLLNTAQWSAIWNWELPDEHLAIWNWDPSGESGRDSLIWDGLRALIRHFFFDVQVLVQTAMFAAVGGLAYTIAEVLKLQGYVGYLLPMPIVLSAMHSGPNTARKTLVATFLQLLGKFLSSISLTHQDCASLDLEKNIIGWTVTLNTGGFQQLTSLFSFSMKLVYVNTVSVQKRHFTISKAQDSTIICTDLSCKVWLPFAIFPIKLNSFLLELSSQLNWTELMREIIAALMMCKRGFFFSKIMDASSVGSTFRSVDWSHFFKIHFIRAAVLVCSNGLPCVDRACSLTHARHLIRQLS